LVDELEEVVLGESSDEEVSLDPVESLAGKDDAPEEEPAQPFWLSAILKKEGEGAGSDKADRNS
ncbi:hypothetical protein ACFL3S_13950, partial [Gemmatimonadota bacterium]